MGVKLKVTPQISSDDMVTLAIEQEIKKVSGSAVSSTAPTTLTRTTNTTVKLKNHSIMVISGMIKDDSTTTVTGIPGLSQIPVLGWLFKTQSTMTQKTNVMLFITAHIIDTLEDNQKLMEGKRATMEDFNRQGDAEFNKGAFTDTGRSIQLKNEIEGLSPEEAQKTQSQRDKEKAQLEKAEKEAAKKSAKEDKKAVEENTKLLTPSAVDNNEENGNQFLNNNEDTGIISPEN